MSSDLMYEFQNCQKCKKELIVLIKVTFYIDHITYPDIFFSKILIKTFIIYDIEFEVDWWF